MNKETPTPQNNVDGVLERAELDVSKKNVELSTEIGSKIENEDKNSSNSSTNTVDTPDGEKTLAGPKSQSRWRSISRKKVALISVGFVLIIVTLLVVVTDVKYNILNVFMTSSLNISVTDEKTSQPIPEAKIKINNKSYTANSKGFISISKVQFGQQRIEVNKSAYADKTVDLTVNSNASDIKVALTPVGTKVSLKVVDWISGQTILGAKAIFGANSALSDKNGRLVLTIPPQEKEKIAIKISCEEYNDLSTTIEISGAGDRRINLVPSGKVYFLSKASGKIDVVKTNLDGSDRKTILAGTGKENDQTTTMMASSDWSFLALKSHRDGDNESLYLVDTHDDSVVGVDKASSGFSLAGWQGHKFIYTSEATGVAYNASGHWIIKSYNADNSKLTNIEQSQGAANQSSYTYQTFTQIVIYDRGFLYGHNGTLKEDGSNANNDLVYVDENNNKKVIKSYDPAQVLGISLVAMGPNDVYIGLAGPDASSNKVARYSQNHLRDTTALSYNDLFTNNYPIKILSPNGKQVVWSETRDGKNTILISGTDDPDGKEVISQDEYSAYGWFTDDYILLSKDNSELYAAPAVADSNTKPVKISDYHR
jgi:hypothetical protein